jgi:hypothetical protein
VLDAESGEAVAKLVAARTRLTEITRQLNEAKTGPGKAASVRYAGLQAEWDEAFRAFQIAVEVFSVIIRKSRDNDS